MPGLNDSILASGAGKGGTRPQDPIQATGGPHTIYLAHEAKGLSATATQDHASLNQLVFKVLT